VFGRAFGKRKALPSVFIGSCKSEVLDPAAFDDGTDDGGGKLRVETLFEQTLTKMRKVHHNAQ
jgi:hypothetical protein